MNRSQFQAELAGWMKTKKAIAQTQRQLEKEQAEQPLDAIGASLKTQQVTMKKDRMRGKKSLSEKHRRK